MGLENIRNSFIKVDHRFGPVPFWWWSAEEVTAERVRWQLQKFRSGGLRNIGIINIAPTGPQYGSVSDNPAYFSEQWWNMFEIAVREAERLGMRIFFYDQIGFSGSNLPARIVTEHPEYAGWILRRFLHGEEIPEKSTILLEDAQYTYAAVIQGFNWLNSEATAMLIDRVHGEFERRFPNDLGKTIGGTFQDELPPLPLWTPEMRELYFNKYQEDVIPHLPALFDELPESAKIRRRVYKLAASLAETSFFIPLSKWHEKYDLLLCCDQAGPARRADVHGAQRLYLDYFRTHRWYSAAGSDMDGNAKVHSSMAHLHGGKRVFLESFHTSGWGGSIEETMHWLVPWLQTGVTLYSPHSVYYSTRGGWWEWAPPDTGWRQPYFEHYSVFANTISRVCSVLTEGSHIADIAVHYPSEAACGFMSLSDGAANEHPMSVSNKMPNDSMKHIHDTYESLAGSWNRRDQTKLGVIRKAGRDFDIVDDSALQKSSVENKKLIIAEEQFSVLLLTGTTIMDEQARERVEAWIKQGGWVVGVDIPESDPAIPGITLVKTAEEAMELIENHIPKRVEGNGLTLQRRINDADVFLLLPDNGKLLKMHEPANPETTIQTSGTYRLRTNGEPELWNPVSGQIDFLDYKRDGEWIELTVSFESWPAALIVCPAKQENVSEQKKQVLSDEMKSRFPADIGSVTDLEYKEIPSDNWRVLAVPTLDNTYGDFDLHGDKHNFLSIDRRQFKVKQETDISSGENGNWHQPNFDDSSWDERLWTESAYWLASNGQEFNEKNARQVVYSNTFGDLKFRTWAGRMGRIPRRFLNLGEVTQGDYVCAKTNVIAAQEGEYWIRVESNAELTGWINNEEISWYGGPEEQTAFIYLKEGANEILFRAKAIVTGLVRAGVEVNTEARPSLPKWIYASNPNPRSQFVKYITTKSETPIQKVRLVFAARGLVALYVNGTKVTEHGDFNPYIRQGQEEVDVTSLWKVGENEIKFILPEGEGEVLADGVIECFSGEEVEFCTGEDWQDEEGNPAKILHEAVLQFAETETLWIKHRPHPLPNVGWLLPEVVPEPKPLPFQYDPSKLGQPIWIRFPLPAGANKMKLSCDGDYRVWINGEENPVLNNTVSFTPQLAGVIAAVRIVPSGPCSEGDALLEPIRFETAPVSGELGDWRTKLALPHHSGVVEYERKIDTNGLDKAVLDLGHIRGTAEVWLDGKPLGVRTWRPYRFNLGNDLAKGQHDLRIRVTNTLGTHYEVGRPSSNVGGSLDAKVSYWNFEEKHIKENWSNLFASGGLYGPVRLYQS
ncbi:hypothetical protein ABLO26_26695 [Neobacillus sp. 179-J 1A1 HS]|uniref:hypothetical protein n=1 Tax=Neobacillus driksii TaxID=3035913 RepID=UPI0035BC6926